MKQTSPLKSLKTQKKQPEPICVCISDLHFNATTLPLASQALRLALRHAESLKVPLVIGGDLNDSKAIIRGEVANELISILQHAETKVYILVGNHDLLNEKGETSGLNYLAPYAEIVQGNGQTLEENPGVALIPYQNNVDNFKLVLGFYAAGTFIIMHQGVQGALAGDYIVDRTAIPGEWLKPYTVISGHYHKHQTVGTCTYIGSPFTMTFGEADDGPKGFLILYNDGSFVQNELHLRRHVIIDYTVEELAEAMADSTPVTRSNDLLWIKVSGPATELAKIKKKDIGDSLIGHQNFKLDKLPTDSKTLDHKAQQLTGEQLFDSLIDGTAESDGKKKELKALWREVIK